MNNPYDDFNKNSNEPKNNDNTAQNQNQWQQNNWQSQGQSSTTPVNQTYWQGDTYHSSYQSPSQPPEQPQQSQQPYTYSPIQMNAKPPKQKKPHTKGKKTFTKVLAGVLCCLLISGGSIGGFTALINNGYITLKGSNTSSAVNQAFTATKVVNSSTSASTTGQLTSQQIAKKVIPSVVCIENYQVSSRTTGGTTRRGSYDDQNGDQTGGTNDTAAAAEQGSSVDPTSEGSGIIATTDGYIITNAHVVDGATSLKVITSDNKTYVAKLIGSDSVTDLAVIKIEATGLTAAEFGVSGDLQVADTVMAVGNPGGMEFNSSVTVGYVSALNREITNSTTGYTMKCIQTDAAINPGNSGGALVNSYGQVVGINSSKIVATGYEGLGFAIPIDVAQPVISELKQYGYVKDRAVLGIAGQYIDSMTARFYGLTPGMYVASVTSDAVTAAGIEKGDVITTIDGKTVTAETTITAIVNAKKPGDTVTLNVTRSSTGKTFTATVKLAQSTGK